MSFLLVSDSSLPLSLWPRRHRPNKQIKTTVYTTRMTILLFTQPFHGNLHLRWQVWCMNRLASLICCENQPSNTQVTQLVFIRRSSHHKVTQAFVYVAMEMILHAQNQFNGRRQFLRSYRHSSFENSNTSSMGTYLKCSYLRGCSCSFCAPETINILIQLIQSGHFSL